jgi:hypothetical protein
MALQIFLLVREGIRVIRLPFRSTVERVRGAICPFRKGRMFESDDLCRAGITSAALTQYVAHYHGERNHQGLGNRLLQPLADIGEPYGAVRRRQRLGGMHS